MWKYTIEVNGMMCGMCESHVNDAVRKACPVKKVRSSRAKCQTVVISEAELDPELIAAAIRGTGYDVGMIQKEPFQKDGCSVDALSNRPLQFPNSRRGGLSLWLF